MVTFHRVLPERERELYPYPGLTVTPSELSFCLGYFAQHYELGLVSQQYARMRAGEARNVRGPPTGYGFFRSSPNLRMNGAPRFSPVSPTFLPSL